MTIDARREDARRQVLASCGARGSVVEELLAYGQTPAAGALPPPRLPLSDEPHVEAWRRYEAEAADIGAVETLRRHFVQLNFPIEAGMSQHDAYRSATRRGEFEAADDFRPGIEFRDPDGLHIQVCPTMGGAVPVVTAADRADFVALVQAFTERNEPAAVPDAMGACLVRGLNNWSRVADHRRAWEAKPEASRGTETWAEEFSRLAAEKPLYQDRLVILSSGPYSAVEADAAGLDDRDWLARSIVIRREHEFTHYFTYRVFGSIRSHVFDELVADFVGLVNAFGRYDAGLALRFLGLESFPAIRPDGRIGVYRGEPALSDEAMAVVAGLAVAAARNLAAVDAAIRVRTSDLAAMARLTLVIFSLRLEELASAEAVQMIEARRL